MSNLDGRLVDEFTQGINAPEGVEDAGKLVVVNDDGTNFTFVSAEDLGVGGDGDTGVPAPGPEDAGKLVMVVSGEDGPVYGFVEPDDLILGGLAGIPATSPEASGKLLAVNGAGDGYELQEPHRTPIDLSYLFNVAHTGDPGEGLLSASHGGGGLDGHQALSAQLYISTVDAAGADWTAFFSIAQRGLLRVEGDSGWIVFRVTSVQEGVGGSFYRFNVDSIQSSDLDPFAGDDVLRVTFDAELSAVGGVPSITGTTTQDQIDSLVAALVALGLATDDRSGGS